MPDPGTRKQSDTRDRPVIDAAHRGRTRLRPPRRVQVTGVFVGAPQQRLAVSPLDLDQDLSAVIRGLARAHTGPVQHILHRKQIRSLAAALLGRGQRAEPLPPARLPQVVELLVELRENGVDARKHRKILPALQVHGGRGVGVRALGRTPCLQLAEGTLAPAAPVAARCRVVCGGVHV